MCLIGPNLYNLTRKSVKNGTTKQSRRIKSYDYFNYLKILSHQNSGMGHNLFLCPFTTFIIVLGVILPTSFEERKEEKGMEGEGEND